MQRYFIKFAYNGDAYHGWQIQENAHTVQAELDNALSTVFAKKIKTTGCSRTDAGVHAKEFYVHFESERTDLENLNLLFKLNTFLPRDIAAYKIFKVQPKAHARYDAISKTYCYHITRIKDPLMFDHYYYLYGDLDVKLMNEASKIMMKYNDFSCFSKSHTQVKTTLCNINEAFWKEENNLLTFTINANRFLRDMVRAIVGTILEVGKKQITIEEFKNIIEKGNRSDAGVSVPAHGLCLMKVNYMGDLK